MAKDICGRRVATTVALACSVLIAVAIFVLTEQTPAATSAVSSRVNDMLAHLFGGVPGLYDPETKLWLGIGVRYWAHTVEFGALGLFVSLAVLFAFWRRPLAPVAVISLAVCACCSLADQCHKLFVPGRHFDWFDLAMDALGYCAAIALVMVVAVIAMKRKKD